MNKISVSIVILGKAYQISCPEHEVESLKSAARMLETKMQNTRGNDALLSHDKIAVITSLNLAHEIMLLEQKTQQYAQSVQTRLQELQVKVDTALARNSQRELVSAE